MESEKSTFVEKAVFAILPMTFSGIVYLISALNDASHRITVLESKVQVVVTSDNRMIINPTAELAREKLREDFMKIQSTASIDHTENKKDVELLAWRIAALEKHK